MGLRQALKSSKLLNVTKKELPQSSGKQMILIIEQKI